MKKNNLIKLAKMLLKFEDIATEEGITITVDGQLEVGKEAYTTDDQGDIVPCPDGEYTWEQKTITVSEGVVTVIADKEAPVETPAEETPAEEPAPEEAPAEEPANEEPADEPAQEEEPVVEETPAEEAPAEEPATDEKDAKIAELEAKIAELEAENAELKAKLNEPAADPAEEEFKNQNEEVTELNPQEKAVNIVKFLRAKKNK